MCSSSGPRREGFFFDGSLVRGCSTCFALQRCVDGISSAGPRSRPVGGSGMVVLENRGTSTPNRKSCSIRSHSNILDHYKSPSVLLDHPIWLPPRKGEGARGTHYSCGSRFNTLFVYSRGTRFNGANGRWPHSTWPSPAWAACWPFGSATKSLVFCKPLRERTRTRLQKPPRRGSLRSYLSPFTPWTRQCVSNHTSTFKSGAFPCRPHSNLKWA